MAVDAVRHVRRRRAQDDRLAKERRQKIVLAAGSLLLLVLLAIQLPGLLGSIGGSAASTPATAAPNTTAARPGGSQPAEQTRFRRRVAALAAFPATDPFAQQIRTGSAAKFAGTGQAPKVRTRRFLVKDPFQPATASGAAAPNAAGGRAAAPARSDRGSYVVVLASVPVPKGVATAQRIAKLARQRGLKSAGVLTSASFPPLRPGFYVVYGGTYKSIRAAVHGLEGARSLGFFQAYPRLLRG